MRKEKTVPWVERKNKTRRDKNTNYLKEAVCKNNQDQEDITGRFQAGNNDM